MTCVSYEHDCNYYKQKCNYDQDCTNRHQFCRQGYCEDLLTVVDLGWKPTGWNRCCGDPQCSGALASLHEHGGLSPTLQVCNTDYDCLDRQQYCARTHQCVDRQLSNYCNVNEDCTPEGVNLVCYNHQCINPPNYSN
uniref:Uncharacterized protein n=1 Tax=Ditylenchus dipsaci TaxID=166011 RepID=A0A915DLB6_9BILA